MGMRLLYYYIYSAVIDRYVCVCIFWAFGGKDQQQSAMGFGYNDDTVDDAGADDNDDDFFNSRPTKINKMFCSSFDIEENE